MIADWHVYCSSDDAVEVIEQMHGLVGASRISSAVDTSWFYIRYFDAFGHHVRYRNSVSLEELTRINNRLLHHLPHQITSWTLHPFRYEASKWGQSPISKSSYLGVSHLLSAAIASVGPKQLQRQVACMLLTTILLDSGDPDADSVRAFLFNHYRWWEPEASTFDQFMEHTSTVPTDIAPDLVRDVCNRLNPARLQNKLIPLLEALGTDRGGRPLSFYLHHHIHLLHNRAGLHFTDEADSVCNTLANYPTLSNHVKESVR